MALIGKTKEQVEQEFSPLKIVWALIWGFVTSYGLARVIMWTGKATLVDGLLVGVLACVVFAAPAPQETRLLSVMVILLVCALGLLMVSRLRYYAFKDFDLRNRRKVCVIGATVHEQLFDRVDPINKKMKIGRADFRVVGVMEKQGSAGFFGGLDRLPGVAHLLHGRTGAGGEQQDRRHDGNDSESGRVVFLYGHSFSDLLFRSRLQKHVAFDKVE